MAKAKAPKGVPETIYFLDNDLVVGEGYFAAEPLTDEESVNESIAEVLDLTDEAIVYTYQLVKTEKHEVETVRTVTPL